MIPGPKPVARTAIKQSVRKILGKYAVNVGQEVGEEVLQEATPGGRGTCGCGPR